MKDDIEYEIYKVGLHQMSLRSKIWKLERELESLKREMKATDKEMFNLRSTKEYEEYVRNRT